MDQLETSFQWPIISLRDHELPFGKFLRDSMFDVICTDLRQPRSGARGSDSPGSIRAIGHKGADEQLVSIASGHM